MTRKMKDSGVEWIGEIPEDWEVVSLNRVLKTSITDGPHETPEYQDEGIPFISVDSLGFGKTANLDVVKKFISKEDFKTFNKKTNLEVGDILFTKAATIGKLAIMDEREFMVWSPIAVIKVDDKKMDSEFLYHIFSSNEYIMHVTLLGTSNTQVNVGMRTLEKSKISLPSLSQQKAIADFLDEKVLEIDNIISKTKAVIEEYKRYKESLIAETVTKGLDKNIEMKDSRIKWIGDIPEHWNQTYLKNISKIGTGFTPSRIKNEYWKNGSINWMASGEINQEFVYKTKEKLNNVVSNDYSINILKPNTIMMALVGQGKTKGKVGILKIDAMCNQNLAYIIADEQLINYKFLYYYLKSLYKHLRSISGESQAGIYLKDIKPLNVVIPPLKEQKSIASYLDKKCTQIDNIISTKEKLLTEMESYKKSLIYETVTGKREV